MIGVDVAPGRALHLRRGHGVHRGTEAFVPVERQVIDQHVAKTGCGSSRGLERTRQLQRDVLLRLVQLGLRHRVIADAPQLLHELDQGAVGLGGHDGRGRDEVAGQPACGEAARGAVGVAVRFAQILVEPAGERAAEDRVQNLNRRVVRRAPRNPRLTDPDHGLSGARFVDEVERSRRGRRGFALRERRYGTSRPPAEASGEQALCLRERDVPDHENLGGIGPIGRLVEGNHAVVRQLGRRRVVAGRGVPVWVSGSEHDRRKRDTRHGHRLIPLLQNCRGEESALPRDLGIGELRPQQHVGKQVKCRLEMPTRHVESHRDGVEVAHGGELSAEVRDFVGERERTARAGALGQHVGREGGEPGDLRRIARGAGVHQNLHLDHRHLVHLDHRERQPIAQRDGVHGGQVERRRGPECGGLGAIDLGSERTGDQAGEQDCRREDLHGASFTARSGFPCGTTESTTRCASRR